MAEPALAFYFAPGSSSMAPHIALHEIGVPFETHAVSLAKDRTPEFLAVNPEGKVPVLVVNGAPLTEVAAILFYLARSFPAAALLPGADSSDGIEAEARVISWMSFIASTVHPARRQGPEQWRAAFDVAERRLGPRDWAEDTYSIADIHLFRLFWRFRGSTEIAPGDLPHLSAHYDRMMDRPAVRRTIEIETEIGHELPA